MSNEDIIKEIDHATRLMRETIRKVNGSLCHARNAVENAVENAVKNEDAEKAYNKGLEDAWKLARKICGNSQTLNKNYTANEVYIIFGMNCCSAIDEYSYQEALASSANIKVGRRELNVAMKATKAMIAIEEEMDKIAQDNYRDVDKYNALNWVLEQCK